MTRTKWPAAEEGGLREKPHAGRLVAECLPPSARQESGMGRILTLHPERRSPTRQVLNGPENAPTRRAVLQAACRVGGSVKMRPVRCARTVMR